MLQSLSTFLNQRGLYRFVELCAILLFLFYNALLGGEVYSAFRDDLSVTNVCIALGVPILAYVAADFFSGFVHFLGDNFGSPQTTFVGPHLVRPFRDHHVDPKGITRHSFIEVNGTNCLISLFVLIPAYHLLTPVQSFFGWVIGEAIVFFLFCIFLTNQIHKWAHADKTPALARYLQKKNIILSPAHHQVHHTSPYDKYYCITSGWLNAFLTRVSFFETILWVVRTRK